MPSNDKQFKLRLPKDLRTKLEHAATSRHDTLTGEIVRRLEHSFMVDDKYASLVNNYQLLLRQQLGNQNVIRNQSSLSTMLTRLFDKLQKGVPKSEAAAFAKLVKQTNAAAQATLDVATAVKAGIDDGTFRVPPETLTEYLIESLEDKEGGD